MIALKLFPKILGVFINENSENYKDKLTKKCYYYKRKNIKKCDDWVSKVYNSNSKEFSLYEDDEFKELLNWIDEKVLEYCQNIKIKPNLSEKYSWFNIYKKQDFQEYHSHPDSVISVIYYLKGSEKSAKTHFVDFEYQKMNHKLNITDYNEDNSSSWHMPFEEGKLVVFRSDMFHCVEQHNLKTDRVSLAINYR